MRIIDDVLQGSPEWHALRMGIPTASAFHRILTAKTLKPSAQADKYMHELLAEWFLAETCGPEASGWMARGTELEPYAARYYALVHDVEVREVGFVVRDDGMVGCSPDRLVGGNGELEIKCPSAHVHVAHLLGLDAFAQEHRLQIQGNLWIAEREWCDILSYNPVLPEAQLRVHRDEKVIAALDLEVGNFVDRLQHNRDRLKRLGCQRAQAQEVAA